ncbi:alpha/beta hydrolase [Streptomyces sp. NPDC000594]|uniref:alpha/beta hydrolase family protein n=1 Tax=Streptomyces sp. NPDC000594 TaxID=3154261 RepID=UPI0033230695
MITTRRGAVAALLALSMTLPLVQAATATAAAPSDAPSAGKPVSGKAVSAAAPSAAFPSAAPARKAPSVVLPRPTGPHAVGVSTLQLTDRTRTDPWLPQSGARRLLVSVHHPARPDTGGRVERYLRPAEARELVRQFGDGTLPPGSAELLAGTESWARQGARPTKGRFPLVVLSPGFGTPRKSQTLLAEDLASRGYVVASVDHAYESRATAFPGRGVLPCVACEKADSGEITLESVAEGRARDISFVLDRLTGPRPVWKHSAMIDASRIGMAGHSIGGASAASTMARDTRVDAGVNMDGSFFDPVPRKGLDGRPFLMLGAEDGAPGSGDATWEKAWKRLDGWKRWLTVTGTQHDTFSDLPVLADRIPGWPTVPGSLPGDRAAQITRTYVAAFLDRHLKAAHRPVLNGPTRANPEVLFHAPR